jgi:hypothetical protein
VDGPSRFTVVADIGTFALLRVTLGGRVPTSLEFTGDTAYVTTLDGEVWKIRGVSRRRD